MKTALIIPAAGSSSRFGEPGRSKLDEDMAGRPVLQRTVELFIKRDEIDAIVVAGPHDEDAFATFKERHGDKLGLLGVTLCRGGKSHRWETVRAALEHVPEDCTHIAVHDGARPATPPELLDRLFDAARAHGAVIPGVEVNDTLKRLGDETVDISADPVDAILGGGEPGASKGSLRVVGETVSREGLIAVQTPQIFEADLLRRAYAQEILDSTDDAGLAERLGERVVVVEGDPRNIKITRPLDVRLAMAILGLKEERGRASHKKF